MNYCFGDANMVRRPRPGEWTEEQVNRLRECAAAGMTPAEAATLMGRSRHSILTKSSRERIRWGKTPAPWSQSEMATLHRLAETHTMAEVAVLVNRSEPAVAMKAYKLGISFRKYGTNNHRAKLDTPDIAQLFVLRDEGVSTRQIASQLGVTTVHVSKIERFEARYRESLRVLAMALTNATAAPAATGGEA